MVPSELKPYFSFRDGKPRVDTSMLYPPFLIRVCVALRACHARGQDYYATSGWRDLAEQERRYKAYKAGTGTRAAPPDGSAHPFGLAIDFAPDGDPIKPHLQADYSAKRYKVLIEEVRRVGLVSGASFNDSPHVQIPRYVSRTQIKRLYKIYKDNVTNPGADGGGGIRAGLDAVWEYLYDVPNLWE